MRPSIFVLSRLEMKTPPPGYICLRCNVPGHFIQHCLTNGNHEYDVKRVKPPTGIPKSMLMATLDGSYSLPSGAVAVLKLNEYVVAKFTWSFCHMLLFHIKSVWMICVNLTNFSWMRLRKRWRDCHQQHALSGNFLLN